ncbi:hypothetical protein BC834DRAFT_902177, partial [Gloeopeniophorella convolvens]
VTISSWALIRAAAITWTNSRCIPGVEPMTPAYRTGQLMDPQPVAEISVEACPCPVLCPDLKRSASIRGCCALRRVYVEVVAWRTTLQGK